MSAPAKPLRQAMPRVAEFVDAAREAFGAAAVDQAIRNGLAGGTDFHASEGGHTVGHLPAAPGASFTFDQLQITRKSKDAKP
ncbi:MAG TPA: hypothetical protein PLL14_10330 [Accumulibacter sp.]|nr:hypothetical protein [Accumulibacter sp.]